jgi:hypothetical protein
LLGWFRLTPATKPAAEIKRGVVEVVNVESASQHGMYALIKI